MLPKSIENTGLRLLENELNNQYTFKSLRVIFYSTFLKPNSSVSVSIEIKRGFDKSRVLSRDNHQLVFQEASPHRPLQSNSKHF